MSESPADPPAAPAGIFAALSLARPAERVGGGYETDVYRCSERGLALKLKHATGSPAAILAQARRLRAVAERFERHLGAEHTVANAYLVVDGPDGLAHVLAVQPFLAGAQALDALDVAALSPVDRAGLAAQLAALVDGALACYRATGYVPDLYGLGHHDAAQARRWDLRWAIGAGWHIVAGQPLISAHNLLRTPDGRVVLVDYDPICNSWLSCRVVYAARALLLLRDRRQVAALARRAHLGGGGTS